MSLDVSIAPMRSKNSYEDTNKYFFDMQSQIMRLRCLDEFYMCVVTCDIIGLSLRSSRFLCTFGCPHQSNQAVALRSEWFYLINFMNFKQIQAIYLYIVLCRSKGKSFMSCLRSHVVIIIFCQSIQIESYIFNTCLIRM